MCVVAYPIPIFITEEDADMDRFIVMYAFTDLVLYSGTYNECSDYLDYYERSYGTCPFSLDCSSYGYCMNKESVALLDNGNTTCSNG